MTENNPIKIIARAISTDWDSANMLQRRWWLLKAREAMRALAEARIAVVPLPEGPIDFKLDSAAKDAIAEIIQAFDGKIEPSEAIQRALGTEALLLRYIRDGSRVVIESKGGGRLAVDLLT